MEAKRFGLGTAKIGQYYYAPHFSLVGVYVVDSIDQNSSFAHCVKTFATYAEAREYVYQMNGWDTRRIA